MYGCRVIQKILVQLNLRDSRKIVEYLTSDEGDDELLTLWEELLVSDFYKGAKEWLKHNYDEDEWKETLE